MNYEFPYRENIIDIYLLKILYKYNHVLIVCIKYVCFYIIGKIMVYKNSIGFNLFADRLNRFHV